jgi:phage terminase small subunit
MAITTRQQLFIAEYLSDPKRNGAAAARRAGYSAKRASATAAEILADKEIQEEIKRQLAGQLHKLHIDADMVIAGILATIENAAKSGAGAWQATAQLRGYELLGKHLGMFVDKVEVGLDEKLMEQLLAGCRRALEGLHQDRDQDAIASLQETAHDDDDAGKPN